MQDRWDKVGGNPAPGDPGEITQHAGYYQSLHDDTDVVLSKLSALVPSSSSWQGSSSSRYATALSIVHGNLTTLKGTYSKVASEMNAYAKKLEQSQEDASRLLRTVENEEDEIKKVDTKISSEQSIVSSEGQAVFLLQGQLSSLEFELSNAQTFSALNPTGSSQVAGIQSQISQRQSDLSKAQAEVAKANAEISKLESEKAQAQSKMDAARLEISNIKTEITHAGAVFGQELDQIQQSTHYQVINVSALTADTNTIANEIIGASGAISTLAAVGINQYVSHVTDDLAQNISKDMYREKYHIDPPDCEGLPTVDTFKVPTLTTSSQDQVNSPSDDLRDLAKDVDNDLANDILASAARNNGVNPPGCDDPPPTTAPEPVSVPAHSAVPADHRYAVPPPITSSDAGPSDLGPTNVGSGLDPNVIQVTPGEVKVGLAVAGGVVVAAKAVGNVIASGYEDFEESGLAALP